MELTQARVKKPKRALITDRELPQQSGWENATAPVIKLRHRRIAPIGTPHARMPGGMRWEGTVWRIAAHRPHDRDYLRDSAAKQDCDPEGDPGPDRREDGRER